MSQKVQKYFVINRIQEVLDEQGLGQTELSWKTRIAREQINKYINGKNIPRVDKAILISRALGKPVEDVFYLRKAS